MKPVSAIILAAGNSGRMGSDKAQLPFGNGLSFAGQMIKCYSGFGVAPLVMVVNNDTDLSQLDSRLFVPVLNDHPEYGRSRSILLGVKEVSSDRPCFLHNIDNPYLEDDLLEMLLSVVQPDSYVVPVYKEKGGHPVLLGSEIVNYLRDINQLHDLREVLKQFRRIEISFPDKGILWNINTPEDYNKFMQRL
jgi:molybdenum cofactor cytidylyltransferase